MRQLSTRTCATGRRRLRLLPNAGARRSIARAWNGCIGVIEGWPERRLLEPAIKTTEEPEWEKFPEGLRRDIEAHIGGLTRRRRDARGNRREPCRPSTIRTRKAELKAAARMAVREGVAIESLCSLAELVRPDVAELVIEAYWKADGPEPTVYTIDLGWKLLSIARSIGCLDDVAMERLDDMRASLETHRRGGLTEKNMILVRQVISGDVCNLPEALMAQARLWLHRRSEIVFDLNEPREVSSWVQHLSHPAQLVDRAMNRLAGMDISRLHHLGYHRHQSQPASISDRSGIDGCRVRWKQSPSRQRLVASQGRQHARKALQSRQQLKRHSKLRTPTATRCPTSISKRSRDDARLR
jgi:hypothetical protein